MNKELPVTEYYSEYLNLHFQKETFSVGRNGFIRTSGMHLSAFQGETEGTIDLYPRTSKQQVANCKISVPMRDVPELIAMLQAMYDKANPSNTKQ